MHTQARSRLSSEEDAHRSEHCRAGRWVADWYGRVVGFGQYDQHPGDYSPRKFNLDVVVDPDYLGQGIGRRLYEVVFGALQALEARTVETWSREDMAARVAVFARRGFLEDMRMWASELDLTRLDTGRFADVAPAVEAQGIHIRTLADLGPNDSSSCARCTSCGWRSALRAASAW